MGEELAQCTEDQGFVCRDIMHRKTSALTLCSNCAGDKGVYPFFVASILLNSSIVVSSPVALRASTFCTIFSLSFQSPILAKATKAKMDIGSPHLKKKKFKYDTKPSYSTRSTKSPTHKEDGVYWHQVGW